MSVHIIAADTTSKLIEVMIRSSSTGQGLAAVAFGSVSAYYIRSGDAANHAITTCAAANLGTYYNSGAAGSGGGWHEVDATHQPGLYQFSLPDAALAAGVTKCTVTFEITGAIDHRSEIILADKYRGVAGPTALTGDRGRGGGRHRGHDTPARHQPDRGRHGLAGGKVQRRSLVRMVLTMWSSPRQLRTLRGERPCWRRTRRLRPSARR